jgi:hypothetical protein
LTNDNGKSFFLVFQNFFWWGVWVEHDCPGVIFQNDLKIYAIWILHPSLVQHVFLLESYFLLTPSPCIQKKNEKYNYPILILQVLAAVIKAGATREHEILAEIRDAVFSFIRKMEPKRVMDTMLVSRVRILYIRSLLARSPELQSIKVMNV